MSKTIDELDEILQTLTAEAFIFGNFALGKGVSTPLPDDNHELTPVDKAKQAIQAHITQAKKDLLAEVREKVSVNQIGQFEDDSGYICWYLDDLLAAIDEIEEKL